MRLFGGKKTALPEAESPGAVAQTARWLETRGRAGAGYKFADACPETLLATSIGVLALETLGQLDSLGAERRAELSEAIRARQSASGTFRDPLHGDATLFRLSKFTPLYVEWQETYFALHALDALGVKPDHPLAFVEPFRNHAGLDAWLRTLRFDDFWFSSNYLMFLLLFLLRTEGDAAPTAHRVLDQLDARQDPETGFWGTQAGASLFNGMAGAMHVYGYYQYLGRDIAHQAAAVRSTLELQHDTGLFGAPGGGPCEDFDAVDILSKLEPGSRGDEERVRGALRRTLEGLRACRRDDGSYRWSSPQKKDKPRQVRYSGLPTLVARSDEGDVWSAWFRPLAIAMALHRLGEQPVWPVRYRSWPLLGWHHASPR